MSAPSPQAPSTTTEEEGGGLAALLFVLILLGLWKLLGVVSEQADKSK